MNFLNASVTFYVEDGQIRNKVPQIKRLVESSVDAMQNKVNLFSFGGMVKGVTVLAGIMGTIGAVAVAAAGNFVETKNKFQWVFRDLAKEAEVWVDKYGAAIGRAKNEMMDFLGQMQMTFVNAGFARRKAMELSEAVVRLAYDVASLTNYSDPEVLLNFQSAIVGNVRAVRRYGIFLGEAAMEQEAFNMGFRKGFQELSEQEKVLIRYNLIVRATKDAEGDAIRTKMTWVNQLKVLQAHTKDSARMIGMIFLPAVLDILQGFNKWIEVNKEMITQNVGEFFKFATENVVKFATALRDATAAYLKYREAVSKWSKSEGGTSFLEKIAEPISFMMTEKQKGEERKWRETNLGVKPTLAEQFIPGLEHVVSQSVKMRQEMGDITDVFRYQDQVVHDLIRSYIRLPEVMKEVTKEQLIGPRKTGETVRGVYASVYAEMEKFQKQHGVRGLAGEVEYLRSEVERTGAEFKRVEQEAELFPQEPEFKYRFREAGRFYAEAMGNLGEKERQFNEQRSDSMISIFGETRGFEEGYYTWRIKQLDVQKQKYIDLGISESIVDSWRAQKLVELGVVSQNFFAGFSAGIVQIQNDMITWGQVGVNVAKQISTSMSDALFNMLAEGAKFRDAMRGFFLDILRSFLRMQTDMISQRMTTNLIGPFVSAIGAGVGGLLGGGAGAWGTTAGKIGYNPTVPSYQHGGEVAETGLALVHEGERVISKGEKSAQDNNVVVNVINQTTEKVKVKQDSFVQSDQYIVNVVLRNFNEGRELYRTLAPKQ